MLGLRTFLELVLSFSLGLFCLFQPSWPGSFYRIPVSVPSCCGGVGITDGCHLSPSVVLTEVGSAGLRGDRVPAEPSPWPGSRPGLFIARTEGDVIWGLFLVQTFCLLPLRFKGP